MGRGESSHENYVIPGAERVEFLEGDGGFSAVGRGETAPGGVYDHGTQQEDGPGNGVAPGPGRAKAARVELRFRREP